jgi:2-dehydropantoate 2-reductase
MPAETDHNEWCIAGDGAIGMALARRLHEQSLPVTLLTRTAHRDALDLVYEPFGEPPVSWSCPTRSEPDGTRCHHLVIATKAYSVPEVLEKWGPSLEDGATVYFLQNGTGFDLRRLPDAAHPLFVVNGGFTAYLAGRHHVVQSAMKPIWIGVDDGADSPSSSRISGELELLDAAGFHVRWTPDIARYRWEKIAINAIVNAQAVIHDCSNGHLLEHPEASRDTLSMCEELGRLFSAMSVDLEGGHLHEVTLALLEATSRNVCSTLQDYRRGMKHHELDYINLALLKEARSRGIEMPVQEKVYARVTELFERNGAG